MSSTIRAPDSRADVEGRSGWGWWMALGVVLIVVGLLALGNLFIATAASVFFVGAMMIIAGIAEILFAFSYWKQWGRFFLWLLLGLLYLAAGIVTFRNPALATAVFTLVLAASLIAAGIVKIVGGFRAKSMRGWGWLVASGVLTVLIGVVIAAGWPVNSVWVLGMFLAIDLLFGGSAFIGLGAGLRGAASRVT